MDILKIVLGIAAGGAVGYLWHKMVGCASGACPIVRNPYLSAGLGAVFGFFIMMSR